tara:strand:+ start:253 stop:411 length:159 start_codon:yes stop_codon:yes gene_type:complete
MVFGQLLESFSWLPAQKLAKKTPLKNDKTGTNEPLVNGQSSRKSEVMRGTHG